MAGLVRTAAAALLCALATGVAAEEQWAETDTSSAQLAYTDLDLVGTSTVLAPDGGMRIVTFWARPGRAGAAHPELPYDPSLDLKAVTRCITELGPDEKVIRDRCWQSQP